MQHLRRNLLSICVSPYMFEMLYERGNGQLWYCEENGVYVDSHYNKGSVRQGCVLGAFFFCLVTSLVYARVDALATRP